MQFRMNESLTTPALPERILRLAERGEIQEIENMWIELTEAPPSEAEFYVQLTRYFTKAHALDSAHNLVVLLINELSGRNDWKLVYRIVNALAGNWPTSEPLRKSAEQALRNQYASNPNL